MSKFILPTASPLKASVRHILNLCKVPPTSVVEEGSHFAVVVSGSSLSGLVPTLRCVQQDHAEAAAALFGGQDRATQAIIQQWIILSQQLTAGVVTLPEVEALMTTSSEYLCDPKKAMAADIIFFNAARWASTKLETPIPRTSSLAKWLAFAEKGTVLKEFLAAFPEVAALGAVEPAPNADATTGAAPAKKGGASGFVIPNAEEIERRRLEKEKAKAEKETAKAAAAAANPAGEASGAPAKAGKKATAVADSSAALDIRVGQIIEIAAHPEAEKLYVEKIDLGSGEIRTIVSGLVAHYKAEELLNQHVVVVYNMKPKALKGVMSEGMVLCAGPKEGDERVVLVKPPTGSKAGDRVCFGGKPVPTEKVAIPGGNKMTDLLAPLHTDEKGTVQWESEDATVNGAAIVVTDMTAAKVK